MQTFDLLTLLLTAGLVVGLVVGKNSSTPTLILLASIATVFGVVHVLTEGGRWQMVPTYVALSVTVLLVWVNIRRGTSATPSSRAPRFGHWLVVAVPVISLILTGLLSYAFPMFKLGKPSGSYAIGTTELHLINAQLPEQYTADPTDQRELMIRVWYPAESTESKDRAYYWRDAATRSAAVTSNTPLPWFTFSHLGRILTNSFWNAPISNKQPTYPVVLYSHGTGIGWESANTKLAEGLASHGYIVVGINHTFVGSVSIFPNGKVITHHQPTAVAMSEPPPEEIKSIQSQLLSSDNWEKQIQLYERAMSIMPTGALAAVGRALDTQISDQRFVMTQLERLQLSQAHPLAAHLNLNRIGIVGMSLGGSATFETCSVDQRCKAGVNLDGFHPRQIGKAPENTPFLYVNRKDNLLFQENFQRSTSPAYSVLIPGATHFNFFDFSIMSPLYRQLGVLGPIDGNRVLDITEASVRAFLDLQLKEPPIPAWETSLSSYPEVTVEFRGIKKRPTCKNK